MKEYPKAKDRLGEALTTLEKLYEEFPKRIEYLSQLSEVSNNQGFLFRRIGEHEASEQAYRSALTLRQKLVKNAPDGPIGPVGPRGPAMLNPMKTWGLVLSGGVAWGIANGGVLEVLEREDLQPDCIAGSSMGAIVAALHALGHPAKAMHDLCKTLCLQNVAKWDGKPFEGGLHGGLLRQCIREHLAPLFGDACIGDCRIPFICVAGKVKSPIRWERALKTGFADHLRTSVELHVFPPETKVIDAVIASTAVPILFKPAKVNGESFVDLLSFGSVPARTLKEYCDPDLLIATDTNDRREALRRFLPPGFRELLQEGFATLDESLAACDLVIRPQIRHATHRFDKATQIYECGKKAAEEALPHIKRLLSS